MIIIANKILTHPGLHAPLKEAAVVVLHDRIHAIGKSTDIVRNYRRHRIVRMENALLMPGLVNLHAHLELPPLLDQIRAKDYPDWVLSLLKFKKRLTKNDYASATKRNADILTKSGTTTVGEICTHGISPVVLKKVGLRAVIFYEIISMVQDRHALVLPRFGPASRLIRYGYSPHSPHTVSEIALRELHRITAQRAIPLCMHVAETNEESRMLQHKKSGLDRLYAAAGWDTSLAPRGRSSFAYLYRIGIVSPRFLAVHAVQTDNEDIALIKRSGAGIAHCPRSNHEIGVGTMPLRKFLDARISVGLGTDSLASSPSLNLWDEMRYAYQVHRRSGVTLHEIFHIATLGGARALGMDQEIGSLEPGKYADIIAVPLPERDTGDLYSDLLRETKTCIMTMVHGQILHQRQ